MMYIYMGELVPHNSNPLYFIFFLDFSISMVYD